VARKNVIALLDNRPELGRDFKAQMARRRPVSRSEYRNAQRVTGKKDVDLADVRDIRAKGIKAPVAPSRPRRSRKTRTAPAAPKKKVPAPQYPTVNSRPVDDDPTKAHLRTGGRVGEAPKPRAEFDPSRTPPPLGGFRQKVKVDEHGGVSANEAPKPKTPVDLPKPKFNAREFAKNAAGDDWANRRNVPYNPRKDPDIQDLMNKRKSSTIERPTIFNSKNEARKQFEGAMSVGHSLGLGIGVLGASTKTGKTSYDYLLGNGMRKASGAVATTVARGLTKHAVKSGAAGAVIGPAVNTLRSIPTPAKRTKKKK